MLSVARLPETPVQATPPSPHGDSPSDRLIKIARGEIGNPWRSQAAETGSACARSPSRSLRAAEGRWPSTALKTAPWVYGNPRRNRRSRGEDFRGFRNCVRHVRKTEPYRTHNMLIDRSHYVPAEAAKALDTLTGCFFLWRNLRSATHKMAFTGYGPVPTAPSVRHRAPRPKSTCETGRMHGADAADLNAVVEVCRTSFVMETAAPARRS